MGEVAERFFAAQIEQQLKRFVEHFVRSGVGAVDLVNDHDRLQSTLECLGQHEPRLWHGALDSIDQHQRAVGHAKHAFHLAAKVGMAGCVDQIDFHTAMMDGDILREDRDAALTLQVVRVEDAVAHQLAVAVFAALTQQTVDQRRLAVVDVGNDAMFRISSRRIRGSASGGVKTIHCNNSSPARVWGVCRQRICGGIDVNIRLDAHTPIGLVSPQATGVRRMRVASTSAETASSVTGHRLLSDGRLVLSPTIVRAEDEAVAETKRQLTYDADVLPIFGQNAFAVMLVWSRRPG